MPTHLASVLFGRWLLELSYFRPRRKIYIWIGNSSTCRNTGATIGVFYLYIVSFSPLGMAISVDVTVLLCQMVGVPDHARLAAITVVIILAVSTASLRWLQLLTRRCGLVSHASVLGSQC